MYQSQNLYDPIVWYALSLPLEARVSQLFIAGVEGSQDLSASLKTYEYAPGSFLFFAYNIAENAEQVISFTKKISDWFSVTKQSIPPVLAVDHEGGLVNRLRKIASPLPSAEDVAKKLSPEQAREFYRVAGKQLAALGFHLNLAPVAEAENDDNIQFLDTRSYGSQKNVQQYVPSAVLGYKDANVSSAVKHFPGNTGEDPHFGLPRLWITPENFISSYLYPFRQILLSRPDAVLMSHIIVPVVDSLHPACLSSVFVTDILRSSFGYEGLVLSDDLYMGAMAQSGFPPERAVVAAVEAGVTMLMLSAKNVSTSRDALLKRAENDSLFLYKVNQAVIRIMRYKYKVGLLRFEDGKIVPALPYSTSERLEAFTAAKKEGDALYSEFFSIK